MAITIGVLGSSWRGSVSTWGAIDVAGDGPAGDGATGHGRLDWFVAADDRWHDPADEPAVRQGRLSGTPVVETRLRVPHGDVVQRVFAIADHGGMTVVEVENESSLPVAIVFAGMPIVGARPASAAVPVSVELPADARVFPLGHRATVTVAILHRPQGHTSLLPAGLPSADQVVRGWIALAERASRLEIPDPTLLDAVTSARCDLVLAPPVRPRDDPAGFLFARHQLARMVGTSDDDLPEIAEAVELLAKGARRRRAKGVDTPEAMAALDAAAGIVHLTGDTRAGRDLAAVRDAIERTTASDAGWLPEPGTVAGARLAAAIERRLVSRADVLPAGLPDTWLGRDVAAHGLPATPGTSLSFAIRWHGARPAFLWETSGQPITLTASRLAPGWNAVTPAGETLWPAPSPGPLAASTPGSDTGSFS